MWPEAFCFMFPLYKHRGLYFLLLFFLMAEWSQKLKTVTDESKKRGWLNLAMVSCDLWEVKSLNTACGWELHSIPLTNKEVALVIAYTEVWQVVFIVFFMSFAHSVTLIKIINSAQDTLRLRLSLSWNSDVLMCCSSHSTSNVSSAITWRAKPLAYGFPKVRDPHHIYDCSR